MNHHSQPTLSEGALSLLEVARENDRHGALEKNAALLMVLTFGKELLDACQREDLNRFHSLLGLTSAPQKFLMITAAALHEVRRRVDHYLHRTTAPLASPVRDFDRHALQGFADALAHLTWPNRNATDFDGPTTDEFVSRMRRHELSTLWFSVVQHYLANIFLDYFTALEVREQVPELAPSTEVDLRLVDARLLAEHAMKLYRTMPGAQDDPEFLALALYQAINQTLEGQSS